MLCRHSSIRSARSKEVTFFDRKFDRGVAWYRGNFPTVIDALRRKVGSTHSPAYFESCVSYLYHPHAPRRISQTLPYVKIIVMLRNPVNRAYSAYYYIKNEWNNTPFPTFEAAISAEDEGRVAHEELINLNKDETYPYHKYYQYSLLARGICVDQLKNLMSFIPKERVLIISSEDFYSNSKSTIEKVLKFLELPPRDLGEVEQRKKGRYPKMEQRTRQSLSEFFKSHNQRLYDYLSVDFKWE